MLSDFCTLTLSHMRPPWNLIGQLLVAQYIVQGRGEVDMDTIVLMLMDILLMLWHVTYYGRTRTVIMLIDVTHIKIHIHCF